jgi:hypothetical protein
VTGGRPGAVPFREHVELLHLFVAHREELVEKLQGLLNAARKPLQYLQDGPLLSRHFEDCLFALTAITPGQSRLRGQLQEAHWATGFRPRQMPGLHNDLVDPGQMMVRGFHLWRQTRWPGRNGRLRYAHTLFELYVIRALELLIMRAWDTGPDSAGERLAQVQIALDTLGKTAPADQPVLVRDARWLLPLAQSPTTDELAAYFEVLGHIAGSFTEEDRLEIHTASVQMAGGHLRSQLRHHLMNKHESLEHKDLVLSSRNSNALDFAVLIQGLVPLLKAYQRACDTGDPHRRLELAGALCQGLSVDPELYVNRVDLLGAYTMIEHLFVTTDHEGHAVHTPMGQRHVQLLQEYAGLISHLAKALHEDCSHFRPVAGSYSPYGLIYGFSSNLTEHIALKTLQSEAVTRFSLEDVFTDGEADKLAWVSGWRKLPHIDAQVQRLFDYPQQFAEDIFGRLEEALRKRAVDDATDCAAQTGRLFIVAGDEPGAGLQAAQTPELSVRYIGSSDPQRVAADKAHAYDQTQLLRDRQEGMFVVSYETSGGWVAITKDILTDVLGAGRDVRIAGLPIMAAGVLKLMCGNLSAAQ